jgi:hypothetical protein
MTHGDSLTSEERETLLNYDYVDKVWTMDSTVLKHVRKALKQGWTPIKQYVYEDGTMYGMVLTAPEWAVTIRSVEKKKLSDEQRKNLKKEKVDK